MKMLDPKKLTTADVDRSVTYHREFCKVEHGKLTSWTDTTIFVQFKGPTGEGCKPENVSFSLGTPISELSGRPGHSGYEEFKRISSSWGYD